MAVVCARLVLLWQVGQHRVARRQLEALNDPLQQFFEANDRVDIIAGGVEPDDHVAAPIRQTFEDGEQDLVFVVSRAVGLDSRAEVPRRADRDRLRLAARCKAFARRSRARRWS